MPFLIRPARQVLSKGRDHFQAKGWRERFSAVCHGFRRSPSSRLAFHPFTLIDTSAAPAPPANPTPSPRLARNLPRDRLTPPEPANASARRDSRADSLWVAPWKGDHFRRKPLAFDVGNTCDNRKAPSGQETQTHGKITRTFLVARRQYRARLQSQCRQSSPLNLLVEAIVFSSEVGDCATEPGAHWFSKGSAHENNGCGGFSRLSDFGLFWPSRDARRFSGRD